MAKRNVFRFDGQESYVVLGPAARLGLTEQDFTIEAWVQIDEAAGDREMALLGTDEIGDSRSFHLVIRDRKPYMGFYNNDTAGTTELTPGLWYHLAWRYDRQRRQQAIFVNGALDATGADKGPFLGRGDVTVGRWGGGSYFAGRIADLRIWSVARSGAEILGDLHRQLRGDEPGLTGYWRLDRGPEDDATLPSEQRAAGSRVAGQPHGIEISTLRHGRCGSLRFAGEDGHVRLPLTGVERLATQELWFRTERRDCGLFSTMQADGGAHDAHLFLKGGNLRAQLGGREIGSRGLALGDGRWHHVAHVVGEPGGERRLYVDGLLCDRAAVDEPASPGSELAVVGYSLAAAQTHFEGEMAEVRLWGRERSDIELRRTMHLRLSGREPHLLGLWPLTAFRGSESSDPSAVTTVPNWVTCMDGEAASGFGELRGGVGFVDHSPPWHGQHTLALEGAGAVEIPGKPGVRFAEHTLEAWILPRRGPLGADGLPLIVSRGYTLRLFADGGLRHVTSVAGDALDVSDTAGTLQWDRWNHLALRYDGRQLCTLIDGEPTSEIDLPGDPWRRSIRIEVEADPDAVVAVVYDGEGYTGPSLRLRAGEYDLDALLAGGFCDDCLSSLRVAPGWQLTVYEHDGFTGDWQSFTDDVEALGATMNNRASSLVVEWIGGPPATVWNQPGADGESMPLFEGTTDTDLLMADGIGPRSVRVKAGWRLSIEEGDGSVQELTPPELDAATLDLASPLLTLGGRLDGRDPVGLRGRIADVRLWSVGRSADEISSDLGRRLSGREPGLVGWWLLAESDDPTVSARAFDASGNHRHGTVIHGWRGLPPAPFERALRLDGESWGHLAAAPPLELAAGEGTLELWLRVDREQGVDAHHCVLEKWQGSRGYPYSVRYYSDSGKLGFERAGATASTPTLLSTRSLDDETFHHVALVRRRRGDTMEWALILDGQEDAVVPDDTGEVRNAADIYLGASAGQDHFFSGEITELRFWDRALGLDDLVALGHRRATGDEPGLVGYWPLDGVVDGALASGLVRPIGRAEQIEVVTADLPLFSHKARALETPAARFDGRTSQVVVREPTTSGARAEPGFGNVPDARGLRPDGPMTIEAWVSPARGGEPHEQPVVGHCDPDSGWSLCCSRERATFRITLDHQPVEVELPLDLAAESAWIHLTGHYDGEVLTLLANGAVSGRAQRAASGTVSPADPGLWLFLGSHPDRGRYFSGDLAEVRLWRRARGFDEIHRDLFQRLPTLPDGLGHPGLVACWPLDGERPDLGAGNVRDVGDQGLAGVAEGVEWVDVPLPPRLRAATTSAALDPKQQIEALRAELRAVREQRQQVEQALTTQSEKVQQLESQKAQLRSGLEAQKASLSQSFEAERAEHQAQIAELRDKRQDWQEGRFAIEDVYANAIEQVEAARQKINQGEGAYRLGNVDVELRYVALDGGATAVFPGLDETVDESRFTTHKIALAPRQPVEVAEPAGLQVPDLTGITEVLARRRLADVGLQPDVHFRAVDRLDTVGRVVEQLPRPGTELAPGSSVLIFLGKASRSTEA